ncbi:DUF3600 domain-containing protein [Paenibacillus agaridevorans]|uniref:DUF3600 domain-containing protein n=1 Tax=Paenibacillus agaridevorans TaxID=171404 RepID=UPI001BE3EBC3|nr:DUF3600 domain-containing protein [Paenibacillus agaridevorans]
MGIYRSDRPNQINKEKTTINAGKVKVVTHVGVASSASVHADRIYESFETVKHYLTETDYLNLSAKFASGEKVLEMKLEVLMKHMNSFVAEHGDNGIVDPAQLITDMQPYFDQLIRI